MSGRSNTRHPEQAASTSVSVQDLFKEHADGVYTLGVRMLSDRHAAEDLVQETFHTVLRRLGTFRGEGSIAGWLFRIAYRAAITSIRKRRDVPSDPHLLPDEADLTASVERQVIIGELAAALDRAIATLDDDHRAAFVLRDIEGLSTTATAEALGIGESAVKMRLTRARKRLRIELKEYL